MEKIASITAALDAGKFPSTQQLNALIEWLTHSVVQPSENNLSGQGRVLANDIRGVLDSYQLLNSNKNQDNLLQEAIWHLTEADVNTVINSEDLLRHKTVRSSLRTILSVIWHNFASDGGFLPGDLASFIRLTLADAAEVVEQDVQDGQRDNLGRDKKRLEAEQDTRIAFEHNMDTLKEVGSGVIGVHQSAKQKTEDISDRANVHLWRSYYQACQRAQKDPAYHSALSTLFDTLHRWISKAFDTSDQSFTLDTFIEDPSPDQHIHKALNELKTLIDRFAKPQSSVDDVLNKVQRFASATRGDSVEVKAWVDKFFEHAHRSLDDPEYPSSDEAEDVRRNLRQRRLEQAVQTFGAALVADADIQRMQAAYMQLGKDVQSGLVEAGEKAVLEQQAWFWRDLFTAYAPRMLSMLKDVPIPRTEYADNDLELILENLDISSFALNPAHIFVRNTTDLDVQTSETSEATTNVGTFTHIRLQAVQLALHDVSFYYNDKKTVPLKPNEFTGLLALTMPPQGVDVDIKVRLIQSAKEREAKRGYHRIERLTVQITDDVKLKVRESNHAVALTLFKPIFNKRFRQALGRSLAEQLRVVLDGLDGLAWDVGRRAEVFSDAGAGRGAAVAAAVWSEIGRLIRERSWGLRATGVQGQAGSPQDATDMKKQFHGLAGQGKEQVQSFQRSVDEKSAMERNNPGWKSSAFDI
ncbi:hypothetical protein B0H13DRAFT_2119756 [Mycena leptocephala]|nr:hypothetical protein B0H13DRAFT_2119756 [Mycena leptocephala]